MKIYIGELSSCSVNNNSFLLESLISKLNGVEIVDYVNYADVIIFTDTCAGYYSELSYNLLMIDKIVDRLKTGGNIHNKNAKFVVSGCIGNGFKYELTNEQKEILNKVILVSPKDLFEYLVGELVINGIKDKNQNFDEIVDRFRSLYKIPYTLFTYDGIDTDLRMSPVRGCLNHCSFCAKRVFQNFSLNSIKYEDMEKFNDYLKTFQSLYLTICSSNLSLYGVDLYGMSKAHELIRLLSSNDNVKYICCGALINFYDELLEEIINNKKIKKLLISLESGSEKIYKLMNRPISLERLKEILSYIKNKRPDITIASEIIAGFPQEKVSDIIETLKLIEEFNLYIDGVHTYNNSSLTKSHYLEGQHSERYKNECRRYMKEILSANNEKIMMNVLTGECYVVSKNYEKKEYTVMFPNNYITKVNYNQVDGEYEVGEVIPKINWTTKEFAKALSLK